MIGVSASSSPSTSVTTVSSISGTKAAPACPFPVPVAVVSITLTTDHCSDQALENMNWITDFDLSNNKLTMLPGSTLNDLAGIRSLDLSGNLLSSFMKGMSVTFTRDANTFQEKTTLHDRVVYL